MQQVLKPGLLIEQVQATVNFNIKPSGSQPPTSFPMTCQPAQLVIPANESCFMAVHFAPTAIRSYAATFEASVENGGDAATRSFSCELRGEGTLPSLTLEMPQPDKGPQALRFPRLLMVGLAVRLRLHEYKAGNHVADKSSISCAWLKLVSGSASLRPELSGTCSHASTVSYLLHKVTNKDGAALSC